MATYGEAEQHISPQATEEQQARSLTRSAVTQAGVRPSDADKVSGG